MRFLTITALVFLVGASLAQNEVKTGLSKSKPKALPNVEGFVTEAEAKVVFERAEKMLRKLTKSTAKVVPVPLSGGQPITREKTVLQLNRLYQIVRPAV